MQTSPRAPAILASLAPALPHISNAARPAYYHALTTTLETYVDQTSDPSSSSPPPSLLARTSLVPATPLPTTLATLLANLLTHINQHLPVATMSTTTTTTTTTTRNGNLELSDEVAWAMDTAAKCLLALGEHFPSACAPVVLPLTRVARLLLEACVPARLIAAYTASSASSLLGPTSSSLSSTFNLCVLESAHSHAGSFLSILRSRLAVTFDHLDEGRASPAATQGERVAHEGPDLNVKALAQQAAENAAPGVYVALACDVLQGICYCRVGVEHWDEGLLVPRPSEGGGGHSGGGGNLGSSDEFLHAHLIGSGAPYWCMVGFDIDAAVRQSGWALLGEMAEAPQVHPLLTRAINIDLDPDMNVVHFMIQLLVRACELSRLRTENLAATNNAVWCLGCWWKHRLVLTPSNEVAGSAGSQLVRATLETLYGLVSVGVHRGGVPRSLVENGVVALGRCAIGLGGEGLLWVRDAWGALRDVIQAGLRTVRVGKELEYAEAGFATLQGLASA